MFAILTLIFGIVGLFTLNIVLVALAILCWMVHLGTR